MILWLYFSLPYSEPDIVLKSKGRQTTLQSNNDALFLKLMGATPENDQH